MALGLPLALQRLAAAIISADIARLVRVVDVAEPARRAVLLADPQAHISHGLLRGLHRCVGMFQALDEVSLASQHEYV